MSRYSRRVEQFKAYYDPRTVGYRLPEKNALGLADYSQADTIRQKEYRRRESLAFKRFRDMARTPKRAVLRGTGKG